MPAWRLGRFVGSLLVLAVLAVGGSVASVGAIDRSDMRGVTASETPGEGMQPTPRGAFQAFGFEWT